MSRYSGEDDRRRSSPYDSVRDRRVHDRKYKFHDVDDRRDRKKEKNDNRERDQYQNQHKRPDVRNHRDRRKNGDYYNRPNDKSSRHYKHQHTRRSPSRSDDKSPRKAISQSNSPPCGKSTRKSGFDLGPPVSAALPNSSEQAAGVSIAPPAITGVMQNINMSEPKLHPVDLLGSVSLFPIQAMTQQATRHARRVYVGGLPPLANEQTITRFFSHIMNAVGGNSAGPGDAVVNVYINHEKKFAFVEMRTVEEASNAMALDGIVFEGVSVRVRRPTDYNPSLAAPLGPSQPSPYLNLAAAGLTPGMNEVDEADRIFLGGVPYYFSEAQIKELLESFGPLRGFGLVKDRDTGNSKGYGFCIYKDPSVTDIACAALNGLKVGDKTLTVRRTTVSGQLKSEQGNILAQAQQHIAIQKMALGGSMINVPVGRVESMIHAETPTKILCLTDVITIEELMDEGEYKEILEDMRGECEKFGELIDVVIPRPNPDATQSEGVGKVFLEYSDTAGCAKAKMALAGRKFGGNTVVAMYFPEDRYYGGNYAAAAPASVTAV